jgi:hypothetical protein
MRRWLIGAVLAAMGTTAGAADPCAGKIAVGILAHDRSARQGVGLLFNYCGRPVKTELLVSANNLHGFMVARMRTELHASAEALSVVTVHLPFVQSAVMLSGYDAEVAAIETLDLSLVERSAATESGPMRGSGQQGDMPVS